MAEQENRTIDSVTVKWIKDDIELMDIVFSPYNGRFKDKVDMDEYNKRRDTIAEKLSLRIAKNKEELFKMLEKEFEL